MQAEGTSTVEMGVLYFVIYLSGLADRNKYGVINNAHGLENETGMTNCLSLCLIACCILYCHWPLITNKQNVLSIKKGVVWQRANLNLYLFRMVINIFNTLIVYMKWWVVL